MMDHTILRKDINGRYVKCRTSEDGTHVFMGRVDFDLLSSELPLELKIKTDLDKGEARRSLDNIESALRRSQELDEEILRLKSNLRNLDESADSAEAELEGLEKANATLLRMAKERANAARNLRPKKQHSGFVAQKVDRIQVSVGYSQDTGPIRENVWKTTIETPYPVLVSFEDIEEAVIRELMDYALADCDIVLCICDPAALPEEYNGKNVVFNYEAHANLKDKSGLWNVCLYSTQPIDLSRIK